MNTIVAEVMESQSEVIAVDVYQKLSSDRILFISDHIDDKLATDITATLLLKDSEDCESKITLFINSPGGDIRNIFMIYDMIKMMKCPVETICIGSALDEVTLLLASGTKGMRYATRNSVICVGQLENNHMAYSDLTNAKLSLDQSIYDNKKLLEALSKAVDKPLKQVTSDLQRKVYMNCNQAIKYGIIDKIAGK